MKPFRKWFFTERKAKGTGRQGTALPAWGRRIGIVLTVSVLPRPEGFKKGFLRQIGRLRQVRLYGP
ncbi:MAG TPA: hypothetical protein PLP49_11525 [Anaerohalosphaeraceae bacterium]|nr:hypothetical protein [Anaerohalosphaeraceae bacterium]